MNCEKCQTDRYIYDDEVNGCTVCTNCGLIANGLLICEESTWDKSMDCMTHSLCDKFSLPMQKMKGVSYRSFFINQDPYTLKLMNFNKKLNIIFNSLNINESIREDVKNMYIECESKISFKGRNMDVIICSFIYIVAKKKNFPIDVKIFGNDSEVMRNVKFLKENMNESVEVVKPNEELYYDADIEAYIRRYANILQIERTVIQSILKHIHKAQYLMRKKEIIAASIIVLYYDDPKMILRIAKIAQLAPGAIKSTIEELKVN